jgi:hypothetical protein
MAPIKDVPKEGAKASRAGPLRRANGAAAPNGAPADAAPRHPPAAAPPAAAAAGAPPAAAAHQGAGTMNRPHYILLPVSPLFIAFSLFCAFLLNLLPWGHFIGVPDFVALVLVFWGVHQPRKVGIGTAFFLGLLMDVHDATLLGENALAYTLLSYFAIMLHRRCCGSRSGPRPCTCSRCC